MDIVCLGEVLIDMFSTEVGKKMTEVTNFSPKPGGAPANVAVAAARLGASTGFIGKVGDDYFGHYLESVLRQEGVDTSGIRYDNYARTTMAFIAKPDENNAEFVFYRNPGADTRLSQNELDLKILKSTKCLHFGSLSLSDEPSRGATLEAIRIVQSSGGFISFDVNYRPTLWANPAQAIETANKFIPEANILKVNEQEIELLGSTTNRESAAKALLNKGPEIVVITLGPDGSYFQTRAGGEFVEPFHVRTIDAIGCGDAFVAGLLTQIIKRNNWRENIDHHVLRKIIRYANAVGAITATTLGVIPALPSAYQVDSFLENYNN